MRLDLQRTFHLPRAAFAALCLTFGLQHAHAAEAAGDSVNPAAGPHVFGAMQWRGIGPYRGGRVLAVAGIPGDPYTFYFGAVAGGVWKTTDAGATWLPLTDHTPISSVGAIAVAASNHNIIYVGTGEGAPRGDITYGDGIYKSVDGGKTWRFVGLPDTRQIGALIVDPQNPDVVLVAALGHAFGPNAERGVFRSGDGGKSWTKVLYKNDQTGAVDVTFDPHNSKIVYAALWQMRRQPWNFSSGGTGSGLYRSADGGITWSQLSGNGLPSGILGRIDVAVSGADSNRVYATVEAKDGGLFRSSDAGVHWQRVNDDGRLRQRAWYFSKIYADPKKADTVYALNTGLYRSTDGGKSFDLLPARHGDHHGLWIDPDDTLRLINGSDGGASITFNGGATWTTLDGQPTAQIYHVAVDNRFPYYVYGAQQDNSNLAIASRDDQGAIVARDWYDAGGGECGFVIPDPRDPDIIYSTAENWVVRYDKHAAQSQVISVWPFNASGHAAADLDHRFNWTMPMIMSPYDPDTLYVGMERLYKTSDQGGSWTAVSGDLTRNDKSKQLASGGPITKDITSVEYYDTIFAIAESPLRRGMLWVGTDDGLVQLRAGEGSSWQNVTPRDLPAWSTISMIELSHFDAGTAYVAVDRHKLDDIGPYIFMTGDMGKTWSRIDAGLPAGAVVHAVREDPIKRGLLYAATEAGVFVSFDDGGHWQSLELNMPRTPIHDLVVKGDDLVAATHGRSFWILDDIAPLREADAVSTATAAFLYKPEVAYRLHYPDQVNARPPAGRNPPAGALIDYDLPSRPEGAVTMEIVDDHGNHVRHLSSIKSDKFEQPPEWPDQVHPTDTLPAQPGANRFVWDLRYDDPVQIPGAFYEDLAPRGPLVLPGKYTVTLSVGGQSRTATLLVEEDPRVRSSPDGLRQKFVLAMQAYHDLDALHRAVNDIRAVKKEIALGLNKRDGKTAEAIIRRAAQIEGKLIQVNITGSEGDLNYPGMLNEEIYAFTEFLDDADTAPTAAEITTYAELHKELAAQLDAWKRLKSTRVAEFRARASAAT